MKNKFRKDVFKIGLLFLVVASLLVGIALPVMADDTPQHPAAAFRIVEGTVVTTDNLSAASGTDNMSFIIKNAAQSPVTIYVTDNTTYYSISTGNAPGNRFGQQPKDLRPGKGNKPQIGVAKGLRIPANWREDLGWLANFNTKATFSDIQVGDRIIARVTASGDVAEQVLIIQAPVIQSVRGQISNVNETGSQTGTIEITPTSGNPVTLNWDSSTLFSLKGLISVTEGKYAVAVYNRTTMTAEMVSVLLSAPAPKAPSSPSLKTPTPSPKAPPSHFNHHSNDD